VKSGLTTSWRFESFSYSFYFRFTAGGWPATGWDSFSYSFGIKLHDLRFCILHLRFVLEGSQPEAD